METDAGRNQLLTKTPDDSQESFQYDSLPKERTIRILELHPGHWDSPISCTLSAVNLDSPFQPYEAVSYTWGDVHDLKEIKCNEAPLTITRSLYEALQAFRLRPSQEGGARFLWADGICIDQKNISERNHQVQLMRQIYSSASRVLIWLGHVDSEKVKAALDLVCQIAGKMIADLNTTSLEKRFLPTRETWRSRSEPHYLWHDHASSIPTMETPSQPTYDPHRLQELDPLFQPRWFTRVWVLQELALSRHAEVFWGFGRIDFSLIALTVIHVLGLSGCHSWFHSYKGLRQCYYMYHLWTIGYGKEPFEGNLFWSKDFDATDPRDKIFGMLGLPSSDSAPHASLFMEPDYTLSKAEVYREAAGRLLVDRQLVDTLALVYHGLCISEKWPSWVPDWTSMRSSYFCGKDRKTSDDEPAVISIPTSEDCFICDQHKHDSVSIRGLFGTTIKALASSDFSISPDGLGPQLAKHATALKALIDTYRHEHGDWTLANTLTAGMDTVREFKRLLVEDQASFMSDYHDFRNWDLARYTATHGSIFGDPLATMAVADEFKGGYRYFDLASSILSQRRLFVTRKGRLGLGPLAMTEGDVVAILFGGSVPVVLRPCGDDEHYRNLGECYMHDVMDGQAVKKWRRSGKQATDFHIF